MTNILAEKNHKSPLNDYSQTCQEQVSATVPLRQDVCVNAFFFQIESIILLIRGKLATKDRITLSGLVVQDVHAKSIMREIAECDMVTLNDFVWLSQLRYYWDNNSLSISMINSSITYGYEYYGNSNRLVITPLTDRCYRTIFGALQIHYGVSMEVWSLFHYSISIECAYICCPKWQIRSTMTCDELNSDCFQGTAATGKTETIKELAKMVAKHCIAFNSSSGCDSLALSKFFKGSASCGAW